MIKERYKSGQKALTVAQAEKLVKSCISLRDECLLRLAIATGIRRSDIVGILDDNLSLEQNYVDFAEQKKGGRIKRTYFSEGMKNTIRKWQALKPKSKYLFPGRGNRPISSKTAYNILQDNLKRAGLPQRPFHALRATAYKLAQKKGWTVRQAAEHIGDSTRVAEEHYGTPSTEEMRNNALENPII